MRGREEEEDYDEEESSPPAQNQLRLLLAICCGACVSIVLVLGFVVGLFVYVIWGSIILSGSKDLKWGTLSEECDTVEIAYIWWYVLYCVLITIFEILYFSYGAWMTCWKEAEEPDTVLIQNETKHQTIQQKLSSFQVSKRSYVIGAVEFTLTLAALIWGWMEYLSLEDNVSCGNYFEDKYDQLYLFFYCTIIIQSIFFSFLAVPALLWFGFQLYIFLYGYYYNVDFQEEEPSSGLLRQNSSGDYETFY